MTERKNNRTQTDTLPGFDELLSEVSYRITTPAVMADDAVESQLPVEQLESLIDVVKPVDRRERVATLYEHFGFYPSSYRELNNAVPLSFDDRYQDVPAFLSHVYNHQLENFKKAEAKKLAAAQEVDPTIKFLRTEDPKQKIARLTAALRSIVGAYRDDARDARGQLKMLTSLKKIVESADLMPGQPINRMIDRWGLSEDETTQRALESLLRLTETMNFTIEGTEEHFNDEYFKKTSDPDLKERIEKFVNSLQVQETLDLINIDIANQQARFAYWTEKLREATGHDAVKAMAYSGLERVGVVRPL